MPGTRFVKNTAWLQYSHKISEAIRFSASYRFSDLNFNTESIKIKLRRIFINLTEPSFEESKQNYNKVLDKSRNHPVY